MSKLARTPDLNTETHEAFVLRCKGHDVIRVWVGKQDRAILVSDLPENSPMKPTRGIASLKAAEDGMRISGSSVRSYILPRDAMMVATVFTDINFSAPGPHNPPPAPTLVFTSDGSNWAIESGGSSASWPDAEFPTYDLGDEYYAGDEEDDE